MPVELNIPRLCASRASVRGIVKLDQFKRLTGYMASAGTGDLGVELEFATNPGAARLVVHACYSGDVKIECNRCGGAMDFRLAGKFSLAMVQTDAQAEQISGEYDPFLLDKSGRVRSVDLIEDELILQIPLAPRHLDDRQCVGANWMNAGADEDSELNDTKEKNPFDILKNIV